MFSSIPSTRHSGRISFPVAMFLAISPRQVGFCLRIAAQTQRLHRRRPAVAGRVRRVTYQILRASKHSPCNSRLLLSRQDRAAPPVVLIDERLRKLSFVTPFASDDWPMLGNHTHQVNQGFDLHLLDNVTSVGFDRLGANIQLSGDLFR
ncbi:hypothetical protein Q31b_26650 [Novipirellula aureliae]|uniref:Uncharacterized protein n=1 Tax=Novipirellula aureliae TaxID=2527966 RepID=A0A5C6E1H0_9BACT|nr:hypothetical protein Q31b_26650 [Novipirellula aureliae]